MAKKVGIVAVAQTKFEKSKPMLSRGELIYEVIEKILQETGLQFRDQVAHGPAIDRIVSCSDDFWDASAISDMMLHAELCAYKMDQCKVAADGSQAVYYAFLSVLAGYETVMVVSHCKESEAPSSVVQSSLFHPIYLRPLGLDYLSAAAMQAERYMHKHHIVPEDCANVVVKSYRNARNNPYAQEPLELTSADVLGSKMIASPLRALDCRVSPSDGACAMIVASEEIAQQLTKKPVWIEGIGNCYDAHYLGDRELADCESLTMAAKRAYEMAKISDPRREIDVAEISAEYSYQELLWTEGLGFCERGQGGKLIAQGITEMKGELPVNPSGGVLPGNPPMVAGMVRVIEAFLQLRGEAGARQIFNAKTALAHGITGPCGQSHCVLILRN